MKGSIRIGLTQRVESLPDRDERRDCLDQAWTSLLESLDMVPVPLANTVAAPAEYLDALDLHGLVLTGGNDLAHLPEPSQPAPERDAFERACLGYARERRLPVLGVCRGLQMMVVEGGGAVRPVTGHVARRHLLHVRRAGALPVGEEEVNSFHDYGVDPEGLGAGWRIVATAPDGTVEAMCHDQWPQWAIMWHPERSPERAADRELLRQRFLEPGP